MEDHLVAGGEGVLGDDDDEKGQHDASMDGRKPAPPPSTANIHDDDDEDALLLSTPPPYLTGIERDATGENDDVRIIRQEEQATTEPVIAGGQQQEHGQGHDGDGQQQQQHDDDDDMSTAPQLMDKFQTLSSQWSTTTSSSVARSGGPRGSNSTCSATPQLLSKLEQLEQQWKTTASSSSSSPVHTIRIATTTTATPQFPSPSAAAAAVHHQEESCGRSVEEDVSHSSSMMSQESSLGRTTLSSHECDTHQQRKESVFERLYKNERRYKIHTRRRSSSPPTMTTEFSLWNEVVGNYEEERRSPAQQDQQSLSAAFLERRLGYVPPGEVRKVRQKQRRKAEAAYSASSISTPTSAKTDTVFERLYSRQKRPRSQLQLHLKSPTSSTSVRTPTSTASSTRRKDLVSDYVVGSPRHSTTTARRYASTSAASPVASSVRSTPATLSRTKKDHRPDHHATPITTNRRRHTTTATATTNNSATAHPSKLPPPASGSSSSVVSSSEVSTPSVFDRLYNSGRRKSVASNSSPVSSLKKSGPRSSARKAADVSTNKIGDDSVFDRLYRNAPRTTTTTPSKKHLSAKKSSLISTPNCDISVQTCPVESTTNSTRRRSWSRSGSQSIRSERRDSCSKSRPTKIPTRPANITTLLPSSHVGSGASSCCSSNNSSAAVDSIYERLHRMGSRPSKIPTPQVIHRLQSPTPTTTTNHDDDFPKKLQQHTPETDARTPSNASTNSSLVLSRNSSPILDLTASTTNTSSTDQDSAERARQAAVRIQSCWRSIYWTRHFVQIPRAICIVQATWRMHKLRTNYLGELATLRLFAALGKAEATEDARSAWRKVNERDKGLLLRNRSAILVQSQWRSFRTRRRLIFYLEDAQLEKSLRHGAATRIQSSWRGSVQRGIFKRMVGCILLIQRWLRRQLVKIKHSERTTAASIIQKIWRGFHARQNYHLNEATVSSQFSSNKCNVQSEAESLEAAALTLQRHWRYFVIRQHRTFAATAIQSFARCQLARGCLREARMEATRIQAFFRGFLSRKQLLYSRLDSSATVLQACWRKFSAGRLLSSLRQVENHRQITAATMIQAKIRSLSVRERYRLDLAARILQTAWRQFNGRIATIEARLSMVSVSSEWQHQAGSASRPESWHDRVHPGENIADLNSHVVGRRRIASAQHHRPKFKRIKSFRANRKVRRERRRTAIKGAISNLRPFHRSGQNGADAAADMIQRKWASYRVLKRYRANRKLQKNNDCATVIKFEKTEQPESALSMDRDDASSEITLNATDQRCANTAGVFRDVSTDTELRPDDQYKKEDVETDIIGSSLQGCDEKAPASLQAQMVGAQTNDNGNERDQSQIDRKQIETDALTQVLYNDATELSVDGSDNESNDTEESDKFAMAEKQEFQPFQHPNAQIEAALSVAAARTIQRCWASYLLRQRKMASATIVQCYFRSHLSLRSLQKARLSASKIQALCRRWLLQREIQCLNHYAARVQACWRQFSACRLAHSLHQEQAEQSKARLAATKTQALCRGWLLREEMHCLNLSATSVQVCWRGFSARRLAHSLYQEQSELSEARLAATTVQALCRGWLLREELHCLNLSAKSVQVCWRGFSARRLTQALRQDNRLRQDSAKTIQAVIQAFLTRQKAARLHSAIQFQALWRCYRARTSWLRLRFGATVLQSFFHGVLARQYLRKHRKACTLIQNSWRRKLAISKLSCIRSEGSAAVQIQALWRSYKAGVRLFHQQFGVRVLQSFFRGVLARRYLQKFRKAALQIQRSWLVYQWKLHGERRACTLIQNAWRRKLAISMASFIRAEYSASTRIQALTRRWLCRVTYLRQCRFVLLLQGTIRGYLAKRHLRLTVLARRIQKRYISWKIGKELSKLESANEILLYCMRGKMSRATSLFGFLQANVAIKHAPSRFCFAEDNHLSELRDRWHIVMTSIRTSAAVLLQSVVRGCLVREKVACRTTRQGLLIASSVPAVKQLESTALMLPSVLDAAIDDDVYRRRFERKARNVLIEEAEKMADFDISVMLARGNCSSMSFMAPTTCLARLARERRVKGNFAAKID